MIYHAVLRSWEKDDRGELQQALVRYRCRSTLIAAVWLITNRCVLCGSTRATDSGARFPADKTARARWIANLQLGADAVKPYSRLRHFPGGDPSKEPPCSRRFISRETVKRGSRVCCTCRATQNTSIPSHDTNNYPFSAQISAQEPARASFLFSHILR